MKDLMLKVGDIVTQRESDIKYRIVATKNIPYQHRNFINETTFIDGGFLSPDKGFDYLIIDAEKGGNNFISVQEHLLVLFLRPNSDNELQE